MLAKHCTSWRKDNRLERKSMKTEWESVLRQKWSLHVAWLMLLTILTGLMQQTKAHVLDLQPNSLPRPIPEGFPGMVLGLWLWLWKYFFPGQINQHCVLDHNHWFTAKTVFLQRTKKKRGGWSQKICQWEQSVEWH